MCQKSLNFIYAFKCYQQNVSGFTLAGPPCTCLAGWRCPSHVGIKTAKPIWLLWNVNRKSWGSGWRLEVTHPWRGAGLNGIIFDDLEW